MVSCSEIRYKSRYLTVVPGKKSPRSGIFGENEVWDVVYSDFVGVPNKSVARHLPELHSRSQILAGKASDSQ